MATILFLLVFFGLAGSSIGTEEIGETNPLEDLSLDLDTVAHLANNPFECYDQQFPTKLFYVMGNESDLALPQENHPIFYGCFDWHSSVHGHWLLALVRNKFPGTELAKNVTKLFNEQFQVLPKTVVLKSSRKVEWYNFRQLVSATSMKNLVLNILTV